MPRFHDLLDHSKESSSKLPPSVHRLFLLDDTHSCRAWKPPRSAHRHKTDLSFFSGMAGDLCIGRLKSQVIEKEKGSVSFLFIVSSPTLSFTKSIILLGLTFLSRWSCLPHLFPSLLHWGRSLPLAPWRTWTLSTLSWPPTASTAGELNRLLGHANHHLT